MKINKIKKIVFSLIICFSLVFCKSESAQNRDKANENITEIISILNKSFKSKDTKIIRSYLSDNFTANKMPAPKSLTTGVEMLMKQLPPDGEFKFESQTKTVNGKYSLNIYYAPYSIPFKMIVNENFKIQSLAIDYESKLMDVHNQLNREIILKNKYLELPFIVGGNQFILVEGEVNGIKGRFMFDTGKPTLFILNNSYLDLPKETKRPSFVVGGSDKEFEVFSCDNSIKNIKFGGEKLSTNLNNLEHTDLSFDNFGTEFLGIMGFGVFHNYEIVINYKRQVLELYLLNEEGESDYRPTSKEITNFKFETPFADHLPVVPFIWGGKEMVGYFDTGADCAAIITKKTKKELMDNKVLELKNQQGDFYTMHKIFYNDIELKEIDHASVFTEMLNMPGGRSENIISIGYSFFKDYITVWNFKKKEIRLFNLN